jgi:hypothetical protein
MNRTVVGTGNGRDVVLRSLEFPFILLEPHQTGEFCLRDLDSKTQRVRPCEVRPYLSRIGPDKHDCPQNASTT